MDFSLDEAQEAVKELAGRIFTDLATHERLKEVEADPEGVRFDRRLWSELAEAGLLGISLPEAVGGAGLGFLETALVVEAAGRSAAYVPAIETLVLGAAPIAAFGSPELQQRWLPGVCAGEAVLTAAFVELGGEVGEPTTTAYPVEDGWILVGAKACVPAGLIADALLVSARVEDENRVGVFVVEASAAGVDRHRQDTTSGRPEALVTFDDVHVPSAALVGTAGQGSEVLEWTVQRALAAYSLAQSGAAAGALALTAEYTKTREQFGKAIATFQAVGQRAADAYIDAEAIRLTAWQAAWRLSVGLPSAAEVQIAKYWAAEAGQRVVHAAVHLHGGVGVDRDYPLHRYFLLTQQIALSLGGATESLRRLGRLLAAQPG